MRPNIANQNHGLNVGDAMTYGVDGAIVLHAMRIWLDINQAESRYIKNNYVWTHNTSKALAQLFPYWSEKKCQRILRSLVDAGALISDCLNEDQLNRGRWYTMPEYRQQSESE